MGISQKDRLILFESTGLFLNMPLRSAHDIAAIDLDDLTGHDKFRMRDFR